MPLMQLAVSSEGSKNKVGNFRTYTICTALCALFLCATSSCSTAFAGGELSGFDLSQASGAMDVLRGTDHLDDAARIERSAVAAYSHRPGDAGFYEFMDNACDVVSSLRRDTGDVDGLIEVIATDALTRPTGIESGMGLASCMESKFDLVLRLAASIVGRRDSLLSDQQFRTKRAAAAAQYLKLRSEIEGRIDPKFRELKSGVTLNVPVPSGAYDAGIAPEAIKDPKLRSSYIAAINANAQLARHDIEQLEFRKLSKGLEPNLERSLGELYSNSDADLAELRVLFRQYPTDKGEEDRIMQVISAGPLAAAPTP